MLGTIKIMPSAKVDVPIPSSLTAHVISTLSGWSCHDQDTLIVEYWFDTVGFENSSRQRSSVHWPLTAKTFCETH
jgi:hypothetical protein